MSQIHKLMQFRRRPALVFALIMRPFANKGVPMTVKAYGAYAGHKPLEADGHRAPRAGRS